MPKEIVIKVAGEYYQGSCYRHEGEKIPKTTSVLSHAKKYNRIFNATQAKLALDKKSGYKSEIIELEEN